MGGLKKKREAVRSPKSREVFNSHRENHMYALQIQGYLPTLLRTQYRCHPNISAVANKLFYGGMLMDGVSAEQRSPVLVKY